MQFAENFHQHKPEPVQFARAARAIMTEDDEPTAADVSRLVGAPIAWTRKALRLLDLPASIVERVERGDLSFTVADVVRRGIVRGDVSEEAAEDLVAQHADGEITNSILKREVGYQPPKPKNYEPLSSPFADESRWAAADAAAGGRAEDAAQREWDSSSAGAGGGGATGVRGPIRTDGPTPEPGGNIPSDLTADDIDGYLLGLVLAIVIPGQQRSAMGIASEEDAQAYAFALRPEERLGVLRNLGAQLLAEASVPPQALRGRLG